MSTQIAVSSEITSSMTSREVAELTGKLHSHVMRDVRAMVERLEADPNLVWHCETETYVDAQGKLRECYRMDRDTTLTLVTGYDPVARMRVIQRWQELEKGVQNLGKRQEPILLETKVSEAIKAELEIAALFEVPKHIAQVEVVKRIRDNYSVDYSCYLLSAPAQSNIKEEDIMLEPADLAKRLNIKDGATVNKWLAECGLQYKEGKTWIATDEGKKHSVIHQWSTTFKSGYNIKWSLNFVKSLLPKDWPIN